MLRKYLGLYGHMFKLNIKRTLEYKANFLIAFFTNIPLQIIEFLFIWVIFQNIRSLNGWSFYEMSLIYGMMMTCKGLADVFFDNLYEVCKHYIRNGMFDLLLIQPMNVIFNMISREFYLEAIGGTALGIGIVCFSISNLAIPFGILQIIMFVLFIICGTFIFGGLMLIATISSLWVVDSIGVLFSIYTLHQFALYPIQLYNVFIRIFVTAILPYAFVSFYPASFFLGKDNGNIALLTPLIVLAVWFVAIKSWSIALRKYSSTGS